MALSPIVSTFVDHFIALVLEASPWLLFGLVAAGLIRAWVPQDGLSRLLGGRGVKDVAMGALIGAPLPICSCGVLPTVIGLRRAGASREASTAFLVATPETSIDSVALSYALLGPYLAVMRPIAAVFSAVVTGLMMRLLPPEGEAVASAASSPAACCNASCGCSSDGETEVPASKPSAWTRTLDGLRYALSDIFEDIALWLVAGIALAAATATWVPPETLTNYGHGLAAMIVMVLVGIPMYICATASTPVAASFLLAGVSPGAAMVFMLAGPATNLATLGVVRAEMGNRGVALYLSGIVLSALAAGWVTDLLAARFGFGGQAVDLGGEAIVPGWIAWGSVAVLVWAGLRLIWARLGRARP